MAKGKIKSIEDIVNYFIDIKNRCGIDKLISINDNLLSINNKDISVLFKLDRTLLSEIHSKLKDDIISLDLKNDTHQTLNSYLPYMDDIENSNWLDINVNELYEGKIISIAMASYNITINKNSFPLKFKKSEFNNIKYRIFNTPNRILSLSKKFESDLPDTNFYIFRLFQII